MKSKFVCLLALLSVISGTCFGKVSDDTDTLQYQQRNVDTVALNIEPDTDGHLYLQSREQIGFFRIPENAPMPSTPYLSILNTDNGNQHVLHLTGVSYLHPNENLVNNLQNPGSRVRRLVMYPGKIIISHWFGLPAGTPLNIGDGTYVVHYSDESGNYYGDLEARQINANTIPVEFRGGGGQRHNPLTIFIEGGIRFSNLDLSDVDKSHHLELRFCSPHASITYTERLWSTNYLSVYNETGEPSILGQTAVRYQDNCFSLLATPSTFTTHVIGFKPSILQLEHFENPDEPDDPLAPLSDWYDVDLMSCTHNFPMSCQKLESTATRDESDLKRAAVQLIVNGTTFNNNNGNTIYRNNTFFVAKSVAADGHVELQNWHTDGNFNLGNLTDFHFCRSGDDPVSNNRVRWYSLVAERYTMYTGHIECTDSGNILMKDEVTAPFPTANSLLLIEKDPIVFP